MSAVEFQVVHGGPHERLKPTYPHFAVKASENSTNRDHKLYDFNRWRPKFHLIAPKGWLNDPCAPGYDAARDCYHVGFQWNPKSAEWDHISWGAAWSPDLVTWDVAQSPSITPETDGDRSTAVFTGCMSPSTVGGSGTLTSVYTSTTHLPIHYTLPYIWGQETIHLGLSSNGGRTWECLEGNPVVPGPPPGIDVTGWRDPFVAQWPSVARILGDAKETLYGIVSGGIRHKTPTTFLYRIDQSLWNWTYVSPIANIPMNFSPSRWAADFGLNWEVTNFLTLDGDPEIGEVQDFLVMGVEGRRLPPGEGKKPAHTEVRANHAQMWMCGEPIGKDEGVELQYKYGGFLDHGAYYAGNSFWDPKTKSHIIIGWVTEEDLPLNLRKRQGWAGSLSIPRVLKLQTLKSVVGTWKSALEDIGSISVRKESSVNGEHSTSTVTTLSVTPDPRLQKLRDIKKSLSPELLVGGRADLAFVKPAAQWELCVSFSVGKTSKRVGFSILHSIDRSLRTTVFFEPETETLAIDRTKSTTIPGICVAKEKAPHTLFKFDRDGRTTTEELSFRCFFDTSVLELFANKRTAITTRVYPDSNICVGVEVFIEGDESGQGDEGALLECDLWTLNP